MNVIRTEPTDSLSFFAVETVTSPFTSTFSEPPTVFFRSPCRFEAIPSGHSVKQVLQNLKDGSTALWDVPMPAMLLTETK